MKASSEMEVLSEIVPIEVETHAVLPGKYSLKLFQLKWRHMLYFQNSLQQATPLKSEDEINLQEIVITQVETEPITVESASTERELETISNKETAGTAEAIPVETEMGVIAVSISISTVSETALATLTTEFYSWR